jgi:endonuclease YncB( thermonuclease family)
MVKTFRTKVDEVLDGDTFKGKDGRYYRLDNVNCPETYQFGGSTATRRLAYLIANKNVKCNQTGTSYGRGVVKVKVGSTDVNKKMRSWGY